MNIKKQFICIYNKSGKGEKLEVEGVLLEAEEIMAAREIGKVVDMAIFDPNKKYAYTKDMIVSKSKNSLFIDKKLKGKVKYTIVIVYEDR